ncbi:MAG: translesion error-prone DNA polymerase V autoproteolytic subunit [Chitinophagaceae bacterium]
MDGLGDVVSRVASGFASPAADYFEERIDLGKYLMPHPSATFLFRSQGVSMDDAYIPHDAILVVDRSIKAKHGHIVVAVVDGEFTVRRYVQTTAGIFLAPEHDQYQPLHIKDGMEVIVWGVVRSIIIDAFNV